MDKLAELLKPYKEIISIFVVIVSSILLFMDNFATKTELSISKCEMISLITKTESQLKIDNINRSILSSTIELSSKVDPPSNERGIRLEREIDNLKKEQDAERLRQKGASDNLLPGACEKIVKSK
jgi:hypothetical protein